MGNDIRMFKHSGNNDMDKDDPWKGILSATSFSVCSSYHMKTINHMARFLGRDIIMTIDNVAN